MRLFFLSFAVLQKIYIKYLIYVKSSYKLIVHKLNVSEKQGEADLLLNLLYFIYLDFNVIFFMRVLQVGIGKNSTNKLVQLINRPVH